EDGIRDRNVTGVQTCALPISSLVTEIIASPPFWLAAACLIAAVTVDDRRRVSASAARSWIPIGVGTSAFMLMGWIMTTTGMSEEIGRASCREREKVWGVAGAR